MDISEITNIEIVETGAEKSQEHAYHLLCIKGTVRKNFYWQDKQSVPDTAVIFYDDYEKMSEYFSPKFDDKETCCCITTAHFLTLPFSPEKFRTKTT
jgi:hypothetical protein